MRHGGNGQPFDYSELMGLLLGRLNAPSDNSERTPRLVCRSCFEQKRTGSEDQGRGRMIITAQAGWIFRKTSAARPVQRRYTRVTYPKQGAVNAGKTQIMRPYSEISEDCVRDRLLIN